jgi:hypothetical protein
MRLLLLCFLALVSTSPLAMAQAVEPGKEGELALILKPDPGNHVCFRRDYDEKHLAAHPKQTVASMELRLAYHRFEPDTGYPEGQRNYYFDLIVKRRDGKKASGVGECSPREGGAIFCGIDCDGGGFYLKRRGGGKSVLVDFQDMWGIRLAGECGGGEGEPTALEPGADDKSFRLDPSAAACPEYEQW